MYDVDKVTRSYLTTLIWTGYYCYRVGENEEVVNLDEAMSDLTPDDLPESIREAAWKDCDKFVSVLNGKVEQHWDDDALGHDFALTRNHHGAGFWDRGHGRIGDILTEIAQSFAEAHLHADPDGIYYE